MSLDSMNKALSVAGLSKEALAERSVRQLLVVISNGDQAEVSMYEFDGYHWQDLELTFKDLWVNTESAGRPMKGLA